MKNNDNKPERSANAKFWREWWNSLSDQMSSDRALDRVSSFQDKEMEQITEKEFVDFVSPNNTDIVFDAGCGTGLNISILHDKVKMIIGMDQSDKMIARCQNRIQKENIVNTSLIIGDITNIEINSNMFDKVICMSVLHYLNDEECDKALKELVRISKDGALIVLHVKNLFSLNLLTLHVAKKIKKLFTKNVIFEHYRSFKWYENKFSQFGIKILDYNSVNKFTFDILPKVLFNGLRGIEREFYKKRLLRKYGADYKIKAQVIKVLNSASRYKA